MPFPAPSPNDAFHHSCSCAEALGTMNHDRHSDPDFLSGEESSDGEYIWFLFTILIYLKSF